MEISEEEARKVTVDFQYFIQITIEKKMAWSTLLHLLTDLAATPQKSKQVIKMLLQELETWVSKVENNSEDADFPETTSFNEDRLLEKSLQESEAMDDEIEILEVVKERFDNEETFPEYH